VNIQLTMEDLTVSKSKGTQEACAQHEQKGTGLPEKEGDGSIERTLKMSNQDKFEKSIVLMHDLPRNISTSAGLASLIA